MTFSIVAIDEETREIGSAVASRSTAVGGTVSYSRIGVGVVNTQHYAHLWLGEMVLDGMDLGRHPQLALDRALELDPSRASRQLIAIDHRNRKAAYTGRACQDAKAHRLGESCVAAGNLLADARVVERLVETFEDAKGECIGVRLLLALEAAQEAGGDRRGRQSAAIKVVPPREAPTAVNLDLRADDHPDPLEELRRLYAVFRTEFGDERSQAGERDGG